MVCSKWKHYMPQQCSCGLLSPGYDSNCIDYNAHSHKGSTEQINGFAASDFIK